MVRSSSGSDSSARIEIPEERLAGTRRIEAEQRQRHDRRDREIRRGRGPVRHLKRERMTIRLTKCDR